MNITLPPLDKTSFSDVRINPRASLRLEQEVTRLPLEVLYQAVSEERHDEGHLNLPLILAQRVLLHGWCEKQGEQEADTIHRIFRVLANRLSPDIIRLETTSTSLWGLLFSQLYKHQFPYPDSAHDHVCPPGPKQLGFVLIFPPSCERKEYKYVQTHPHRFRELVDLFGELGIILPTTIKRTVGSQVLDARLEDHAQWARDLNQASQSMMNPFVRLLRQQSLRCTWRQIADNTIHSTPTNRL